MSTNTLIAVIVVAAFVTVVADRALSGLPRRRKTQQLQPPQIPPSEKKTEEWPPAPEFSDP